MSLISFGPRFEQADHYHRLDIFAKAGEEVDSDFGCQLVEVVEQDTD